LFGHYETKHHATRPAGIPTIITCTSDTRFVVVLFFGDLLCNDSRRRFKRKTG
jgi:hypothetical protein